MLKGITETLLPLGKPAVVVCYALFGFYLVRTAAGLPPPRIAVPRPMSALLTAIITALILFRFSQYGWLFPAAVLVITAVGTINSGLRSIPAELAIVVSAVTLAFWLKGTEQPAGWWRIPVIALIAWSVQTGLGKSQVRTGGKSTQPYILAFAIAGLGIISNMSPYHPGTEPLAQLLHHQGAYIGSALHIRAGLVPFYDVPLQYGLGPTLAIAAGCGISDCWSATQALTVATTVLMGMLLLHMSLSTASLRGWQWRAAVTAVVFCAVFMWPGYPDEGSVRTALPGSGGLRFLPVVVTAYLLYFGRFRWAAAALAVAAVWSPEVAGMAIAVFGICETARFGFQRAALRTLLITAAGFVILFLSHRLWFGVWIQPDVMAEYLLHVPAPLPLHPLTNFVFLLAALALAAASLNRRGNEALEFRRDLISASLLFAAANYYLGRSHPNNICCLMPFIALAGLRALEKPTLMRPAIVGLAAATAAITLSFWTFPPFEHWSTDHPSFVSQDMEVAAIRSQLNNPLHEGIADLGWFGTRNPAETILWTPLDPGSLLTDLPRERRRLYIARSAARLKLAGWAIIEDHLEYLLDDLRVAYVVSSESRHGTYTLAHFEPIVKP